MNPFNFERLDVWQKARSLAIDIYRITHDFPNREQFGLANQMRRAAVSVASNIAEGSTRSSIREKARFYEVAYGSLMELISQAVIAKDLGFLENYQLAELKEEANQIVAMLSGLQKSLK